MNEELLMQEFISRGKPVNFRLLEGRDIFAVPIAQDANVIIVRSKESNDRAILYKRAISVITPYGGTNDSSEGIT